MVILGWALIALPLLAVLYWLAPVFAFFVGKRRVTVTAYNPSTGKSASYVFYHEKGDEAIETLKDVCAKEKE